MPSPGKSAFDLDENVAAGLAYLPVCLVHLVFSIAILATDKVNKLARFHAIQSLLLFACGIIGYICMFIAIFVVMALAAATQVSAFVFLIFLIYAVFGLFALGVLVALVISMIKAFQGQIFKLPIIGNMADKWSS